MALTQNRAGTFQKGLAGQEPRIGAGNFLLEAGVTLYKGGLSILLGGTLRPGSDAAGGRFAGLAVDGNVQADGTTKVVSTDGVFADGTEASSRLVQEGAVLVNYTGVAQADIGTDAYLVDDNTVAAVGTTTNDILVGTVIELGSTAGTCWVLFRAL